MQRSKLVIYKVNVVNQPMIFNERFSAFSLHLVMLNLSGNDCAHHMLMISIIPHVKILVHGWSRTIEQLSCYTHSLATDCAP